MKPPAFNYFAPTTIPEVVALLEKYGSDARVLAGGQSLVPIMNLRMIRPEVLIDLNQCADLAYMELRDGHLAFGPMTRQIDAMHSPLVQMQCPLVAQALEWAGPVAVRSRATVGGTLAHADRVAELPAVAIALDAEMVIEGSRGQRIVASTDFFLGDLTTAVEPDEFLREIRFPVSVPNAFTSFAEVSVRQEGVAVVGLAAYIVSDGAKVKKVAFAAMGVDATPIRLRASESELMRRGFDDGFADAIADIARNEMDPSSDPYASAAYRKHAIGSMVRNALQNASIKEIV